jgi:hypothetical protein
LDLTEFLDSSASSASSVVVSDSLEDLTFVLLFELDGVMRGLKLLPEPENHHSWEQ